jgi:hypothetical protein
LGKVNQKKHACHRQDERNAMDTQRWMFERDKVMQMIAKWGIDIGASEEALESRAIDAAIERITK